MRNSSVFSGVATDVGGGFSIGLIGLGIPLGYRAVGGMAGLREALPPEYFSLGNVTAVQFATWMVTIVPIWFVAMTLYQRIHASRSTERGSSLRLFLSLMPAAAACAVCVRGGESGVRDRGSGALCQDDFFRPPVPTDSGGRSTRPNSPWASRTCLVSLWWNERKSLSPTASFTYTCNELDWSFTDTSTANDGAYVDFIGTVGGTYVYQVCETGTTVCSNPAKVEF